MEKYLILTGVSLIIIIVLVMLSLNWSKGKDSKSAPKNQKEASQNYTISLSKFREIFLEDKSLHKIQFKDIRDFNEYIELTEKVFNYMINDNEVLSDILYDCLFIKYEIQKKMYKEEIQRSRSAKKEPTLIYRSGFYKDYDIFEIRFDIIQFKNFILKYIDFLNMNITNEKRYNICFRVARYHLVTGKGKRYINNKNNVSLVNALKRSKILSKTFSISKDNKNEPYVLFILNSVYNLGCDYIKIEY